MHVTCTSSNTSNVLHVLIVHSFLRRNGILPYWGAMVCLCTEGRLSCFSFWAIMNTAALCIVILKLKKDTDYLTKDLVRTGCVLYTFLSPSSWRVYAYRCSVDASSVSGYVHSCHFKKILAGWVGG